MKVKGTHKQRNLIQIIEAIAIGQKYGPFWVNASVLELWREEKEYLSRYGQRWEDCEYQGTKVDGARQPDSVAPEVLMTNYLSLLALQHRIGFFGMEGPMWFFFGLAILVIFCVLLWRFLGALGTAAGISAPWMQVLYWGFVLFCFVMFVNYAGAHWW